MTHPPFDGKKISVLDSLPLLKPPATSKAWFEIQKKDNWKTCGHLLPVVCQKTGAAVLLSSCGQVGKGAEVFAFRVIPGIERGGCLLVIDLPVHLPMDATATAAPNHDELTLIVGDCTGSISKIFKVELLRPACN